MSGFSLPHGGAIDGHTMRGHIFNLQADHIAAGQLAVDGQIEHGQIAGALLHLKLGPDRPNVLGSQRGLRADQFPFVPWGLARVSRLFRWFIVHAHLLCLQSASACGAFSRRPLSVRFRGVPAFTASLINARKSESDPKRTFSPDLHSSLTALQMRVCRVPRRSRWRVGEQSARGAVSLLS